MPIEFACTACAYLIKARDDRSGTRAKCPKCGASLKVPKAPVTVPESPEVTAEPDPQQLAGPTPAKPWSLQESFARWSVHEKIVMGCSCAAAASMLLPWVDVGIISRNGFDLGTFPLLAFYVYPVACVLTGKKIIRALGVLSGLGAVVLTASYITSRDVTVLDRSVNVSGTGAYLFLVASLAMGMAASGYDPRPPSARS